MWGYKEILEAIKRTAASGGIDTSLEMICNYQDGFGHSSIEQLTELARDKKYNEAFYRYYDFAYGTINTLKFYLNASETVEEMQRQISEYEEDTKTMNDSIGSLSSKNLDYLKKIREMEDAQEEHESYIEKLEHENMMLKAKLYDLMQK